ncbi:tyrosine-type recombinase/integrase [Micrococcus sp. EYE_162]|uniref:tyrosine-type recombinase/integrase n=1 Tax=unclassified Micrococcus TaxID=2620948 RepID=UPI00200423D0|nr:MULTISPECIES: site-specific integrase [unclassified Micrococcus]MCK6096340.1 tyrosine-type recombinase/integrase [Micrococcus sp. EYE_212]MCK6172462.1 tyrosine-type recombinase/integrase [Micrococcus sp. EYE_162]
MADRRKLPQGITRNPGGMYRARLGVDGVQHSLGTFATLGDARAALDIARAERARDTFIPPAERRAQLKAEREARRAQAAADARTVRELAEAWLSWQEARGLKLGSVYTYRRHLEAHFLPTFGERPVGHVTALDLNAWLDHLEESKSPAGAAQVHRVVAALFKWATGDAAELPRTFTPWLLTSPVPPLAARRLRRPNLPRRNRETLTDAELSALADLMPAPDRLAVLLSGWCALRIGEVLALRRRHVTTDAEGTTWIRVESQVQARGSGVREESPKSEAGRREIPVPAVIAGDLAAHLDEHAAPGPDGLLFPRVGGGNQLNNPNTIRKRFNAALAELNAQRQRDGLPTVDNFTWHGLRHTALTRLGQAGATTAELKAYAGHSDGKSVEVYQHAERRRLVALTAELGTAPQ